MDPGERHGRHRHARLGLLGSAPSDINNSGQVVGYGEIGGDALAFFWSPSTGMVELGTLASGETEANAINELGQVVGYSFVGGDFHGFVWTAEDGMIDLGVEEADDINDSGQIVGGVPSTGARHAALLQPGGADNDGDGIDASIEDAGPNAGDGNVDGVLDSLADQRRVIAGCDRGGIHHHRLAERNVARRRAFAAPPPWTRHPRQV